MKHDHRQCPTPETLAAYADGELDPSAQEAVRSWLAQHPEAQNEIDAQQGLLRLYQATPPPEPANAAWDEALAGIQARLLPGAPKSPRRILRWIAGLAAAAAAVLIVVLATRQTQPPERVVENVEPFPVASPDDLFITMVEEEPGRHLSVVGDFPLGELALANHGEIGVEQVVPDEGMNPRLEGNDSTLPIIFTEPRAPAQDDIRPVVPMPK